MHFYVGPQRQNDQTPPGVVVQTIASMKLEEATWDEMDEKELLRKRQEEKAEREKRQKGKSGAGDSQPKPGSKPPKS